LQIITITHHNDFDILGLLKTLNFYIITRSLRKQNDVLISKSSELRLPQFLRIFAMTIKSTFSALSF